MVNRKIILHWSLLLLFLMLQVYVLFFLQVDVLHFSYYLNETPLPLFGENKTVSQEFRCPGPLTRIDVMLADYLKKPESGSLHLTILKNGKNMFKQDFPANRVEDNRFYSFPIQSQSNGRLPKGNYMFQLSYTPGNPNDKLAAWMSPRNIYPYGNLFVNGIQKDGDLTFRVYFASTIRQEKSRLLNAVPRFPARRYLLGGGFLLLFFMVNLLFHLLLKTLIQD